MTPITFLRATSPALAAELGMFLFVRNLYPSNQTTLLALALISWVALPALAGFRVSQAGGGRLLSAAGGAAISGVSLICAAVAELLFTRDIQALGGFVLATAIFALPMQALFGLVGGWAATHRANRGA